MSAAEVEQFVTVPMEQDLLNGVPWLDQIRSDSIAGLSSITLQFNAGTDVLRARKAVQEQGRSLLPIGVVQVQGPFGKGDVVALCDPDGNEFARGLTNYSSAAADKLRGLRTEQIREVMGAFPYEEVVHRDNLVVIV